MENASLLFVVAGLAAGAVLYWFALRPRFLTWGTTRAEVQACMPGDHVIPDPTHVATRSVTINAQTEDVWPWLAQMGYRRGGLYAYDWIDRLCGTLDKPSADRIIPQLQRLAVGDVIPMACGQDWLVEALETNRLLLLHIEEPGMECTWAWRMVELDESHTRLVLRVRTRLTSPLLTLFFHLSDASSFLMTRKHLLGVKRRAEIAAWETEEWLSLGLRNGDWSPPDRSYVRRHPSL